MADCLHLTDQSETAVHFRMLRKYFEAQMKALSSLFITEAKQLQIQQFEGLKSFQKDFHSKAQLNVMSQII